MRVITGRAKGRKLQMTPGASTRPITDRAKEALFSILGDWIEGANVLDLFGGTGGVGIEALSRGAEFGTFVDLDRQAVGTILTNLRTCELADIAQVLRKDSFAFLRDYAGEPFDFIFVAPPQYKELWRKALEQIDERPTLLAIDGVIVVQIHPREETPLDLEHLAEFDRRRYGSVLLLFYAAKEDLEGEEENEVDAGMSE